ncbi:hypothetical protein OQA88_13522 [Cercophora sp. LCS_1]
MFSAKTFVLAALAAVASAAPTCGGKPTPTLPSTGDNAALDLPPPPSNLVLKKIAIGHGIQNYSCSADPAATPVAKGALAVLYDATPLYPGTPRTGLSQGAFNSLTTTVLWHQDIPLNLVNPAAAQAAAVLPSKSYVATTSPFKPKADLKLTNTPTLKFLGHHYFDGQGTPTFDLFEAGLKAHVVRLDGVPVPPNADKGPLGTGAVGWLQLGDSGQGKSIGINQVYRVITAGGVAEACAVAGEGIASVPYTAFYWYYG